MRPTAVPMERAGQPTGGMGLVVMGQLWGSGLAQVLPWLSLVHASAALEARSVDVRSADSTLQRLRGLVARHNPDDPDGHTGLFHTTLAEYLLSPEAASGGYAIDTAGA